MPKFIEQSDLKKIIWGMFLFILFLVKILCIGAYYVHQSDVGSIKADLLEGKVERKEISKQVHQLELKVAEGSK